MPSSEVGHEATGPAAAPHLELGWPGPGPGRALMKIEDGSKCPGGGHAASRSPALDPGRTLRHTRSMTRFGVASSPLLVGRSRPRSRRPGPRRGGRHLVPSERRPPGGNPGGSAGQLDRVRRARPRAHAAAALRTPRGPPHRDRRPGGLGLVRGPGQFERVRFRVFGHARAHGERERDVGVDRHRHRAAPRPGDPAPSLGRGALGPGRSDGPNGEGDRLQRGPPSMPTGRRPA